jgi:hypothetical protein
VGGNINNVFIGLVLRTGNIQDKLTGFLAADIGTAEFAN